MYQYMKVVFMEYNKDVSQVATTASPQTAGFKLPLPVCMDMSPLKLPPPWFSFPHQLPVTAQFFISLAQQLLNIN